MRVSDIAFVACLLFAASAPAVASAATVTGTALYRERIAMPPDAVFEAVLLDVPLADAPATVIARSRIERVGNPPYRVTLAYDPSRIVASHRYVVRATLLARGRLMFTTDRIYPVITGGNPAHVELLLVRAAASSEAPDVTLENTYWKLVTVDGKPAEVGKEREPHLILRRNGEVSGSTGCNGMGGTYTLSDDALSFGPIITTFMFCEGVVATERALLNALPLVRSWKIAGDELTLLDDKGAVLAEFRAVYF